MVNCDKCGEEAIGVQFICKNCMALFLQSERELRRIADQIKAEQEKEVKEEQIKEVEKEVKEKKEKKKK